MRRGRRLTTLSVVIPALNEERAIGALLDDVRQLTCDHEIIVVDGGSADDTVPIARTGGARVVQSERGRGVQLAAGAHVATGRTLCFLHADVRLPEAARRALVRLTREELRGAYAFRFRIDAVGWRYRIIELGACLRVRLFRMPYGDQGLVVSRRAYDAAGGYPPLPLMEDVALVDALNRADGVRALAEELPVSPRRWERDGPFTRTLRNWGIMLAYRFGATPERLARRYTPA